MASLHAAVGGDEGVARLASAWHERCLADPVVSHAFSHGLDPHHVDRLAAYWSEALGGPPRFTQTLGTHEAVQRMHAGNGEHPEMDERAIACFAAALEDADVPRGALRDELLTWFRWATEDLARYPRSADDVPTGTPLPRWPAP